MNDTNALIFFVMGSVMELLPLMFPSWFPPTGADQSSARAIWLDLMGAAQVGLGLGYVVRAHFVPFAVRILSPEHSGEPGPLALPHARSVAGADPSAF